MTDIEQRHNGIVSRAGLAAGNVNPAATARLIELAYRHSLRPEGVFDAWDELDLRLIDAVRLYAIDDSIGAQTFARLVDRCAVPPDDDLPEVWAAATIAFRRPDAMRWISANTKEVVGSNAWLAILPGLAGLTVSVPLAEEALINVMRHRAKPPRPSSAFIQLNPWFSRRFAARYRRRVGGKRLRVRERAATARAWSHARTSVGNRVPFEWSSKHGRGVGRPLDKWSVRLLTDYIELVESTYEEAVPAPVASLYAIASAAVGHDVSEPRVADWNDLPLTVEDQARAFLGIGAADDRGKRDALALDAASSRLGTDVEAWRNLYEAAFSDGQGLAAAVTQAVG